MSTDDARDAAIIGAAQRIEHYEIAAYGCARTYARRLNRADEARLLQETLDEEGRADRRLTEIAEAHINDDARLEIDVQPPRAARLRYVDAVQAAGAVFSSGDNPRETLPVRNDQGDDRGRASPRRGSATASRLGASPTVGRLDPSHPAATPRGPQTRFCP